MKRLYIDLDSLLDTRLGLLHQHGGSELSKHVAASDAYYQRDYDDWARLTGGVVDNATFETWWAARDAQTLLHSMTTAIFLPLSQTLATLSHHVHEGIETSSLSLLINVWPYQIPYDVEKALTQAILHHLGFQLPVVYTSLSPEEVTPAYLVENVHLVYMYDYHQWFRRHSWRIIQLQQSGLTFTLPRRFEKDVSQLTQEEKQKSLMAFDLAVRLHVQCVFIETRYFSLFTPSAVHLDEVDPSEPT